MLSTHMRHTVGSMLSSSGCVCACVCVCCVCVCACVCLGVYCVCVWVYVRPCCVHACDTEEGRPNRRGGRWRSLER